MTEQSRAFVPVRRLDLRLDVPDDQPTDYPRVTVLIDGADRLATGQETGFHGFDPENVLGPDEPLLPTDPPRRVAVYRCSCGEPGCGVVAPLIRREADRIVWSDPRTFTAVYDRPTADEDPAGGRELDLPTFVFDAQQYVAEVRRASADRSWESARRRTARLLRAELAATPEVLTDAGYQLDWVAPTWLEDEVWDVALCYGPARPRRGQLVLELTARSGTPEQRASAMAAAVRATPPQAWPVAFRSRGTLEHGSTPD